MAELSLSDFLDFCKDRDLDFAVTKVDDPNCSMWEELFGNEFDYSENIETVVADSDEDYDEFVSYDGLFADVVTS